MGGLWLVCWRWTVSFKADAAMDKDTVHYSVALRGLAEWPDEALVSLVGKQDIAEILFRFASPKPPRRWSDLSSVERVAVTTPTSSVRLTETL
jgi:hypothetical protein